MRPLILLLILFLACNVPQPNTEQPTPKTNEPQQPTTYLKATIDGQPWEAEKMIPDINPNSSYKRIQGEKGDINISFQLWKPKTGMNRAFTEDHAADFWAEDGIFRGYKGEVTVTKADENFIEGTFYFTAVNGNTKHEITSGSFRVAATPKEN